MTGGRTPDLQGDAARRRRLRRAGGAFRETAAAHGAVLRRMRPYRPQTKGKAEAFTEILQNEWAYGRLYTSNAERLDDLPVFLLEYNHARPHGGIDGAVPASRL